MQCSRFRGIVLAVVGAFGILGPVPGCGTSGRVGVDLSVGNDWVGKGTIKFEVGWDSNGNPIQTAKVDMTKAPADGWVQFLDDEGNPVGEPVLAPKGKVTDIPMPPGATDYAVTDKKPSGPTTPASSPPPPPAQQTLPSEPLPKRGSAIIIGSVPLAQVSSDEWNFVVESAEVSVGAGAVRQQIHDSVRATFRLAHKLPQLSASLANVERYARAVPLTADHTQWQLSVRNDDQKVSNLSVWIDGDLVAGLDLQNTWADSGIWGTSEDAVFTISALQVASFVANGKSNFHVEYQLDGQPVSYDVGVALN